MLIWSQHDDRGQPKQLSASCYVQIRPLPVLNPMILDEMLGGRIGRNITTFTLQNVSKSIEKPSSSHQNPVTESPVTLEPRFIRSTIHEKILVEHFSENEEGDSVFEQHDSWRTSKEHCEDFRSNEIRGYLWFIVSTILYKICNNDLMKAMISLNLTLKIKPWKLNILMYCWSIVAIEQSRSKQWTKREKNRHTISQKMSHTVPSAICEKREDKNILQVLGSSIHNILKSW